MWEMWEELWEMWEMWEMLWEMWEVWRWEMWGGGAERALHANDGGRCRLGHVERDCLIERLCLCEARRPAHNHRCSGCGE